MRESECPSHNKLLCGMWQDSCGISAAISSSWTRSSNGRDVRPGGVFSFPLRQEPAWVKLNEFKEVADILRGAKCRIVLAKGSSVNGEQDCR